MINLMDQFEEDMMFAVDLLNSPNALEISKIRQTSHIARKWLIDGLIHKLAMELNAKLTIPALDLRPMHSHIKDSSHYKFYTCCGIQIWERPFSHLYHSTNEIPDPRFRDLADGFEITLFKPADYVRRNVTYHNGTWFRVGEIIKFSTNKLGGIHIDDFTKLKPKDKMLLAASEYLVFCPPEMKTDELEAMTEIQLEIPFDIIGANVWSCLQIEMLSAMNDLAGTMADGSTLLDIRTLPITRSKFS